MRYKGIGPWKTAVEDQDFGTPTRLPRQKPVSGCMVVLAVLVVLSVAIGILARIAWVRDTGAEDCVQVQYGRGASYHWECSCPDGEVLRFNTFPLKGCDSAR